MLCFNSYYFIRPLSLIEFFIFLVVGFSIMYLVIWFPIIFLVAGFPPITDHEDLLFRWYLVRIAIEWDIIAILLNLKSLSFIDLGVEFGYGWVWGYVFTFALFSGCFFSLGSVSKIMVYSFGCLIETMLAIMRFKIHILFIIWKINI